MNTANIIVTGLNSKAFTKKNGQQGRTFTIEANDGRKYVTWDAEFYNARTVGEQLALNYETSTREWNGKTYTDYKIVTRPTRGNTRASAPADNKEVLEALRKVYARIERMEKNLSAQITLTMGEVDIPTPEDVEAMETEEPEVEDVPVEKDEEETDELKPGDIPF